MKILIVSKVPTHPTTAGNRAFILNNVELLKNMGHEVHFLYIKQLNMHNLLKDEDGLISLIDYWQDKLFFYRQRLWQKIWNLFIQRFRWYFCRGFFKCDDGYPYKLHDYINALHKLNSYDACIVNYYYLTKTLSKINIPKKGLYTHDYYAYKSLLVGDKYVGGNTTADEEAIAMQRTPHIFALNTGEAEYFRRLSPKSRVYNVFNYFKYHPQSITYNHNILFLSGGNQYNINGLMWFVNNIFPLIMINIPDTKLVIGGSICSHIKDLSRNENIQIVGFVDNVNDFYAQGDIAINPTYQGTGLKIKTFEAVSFDKVTLVHPHSIDGVFEPSNAPVFSSDNPEEWVDYLINIWNDYKQIEDIKKKNKEYIENLDESIKNQYNLFLS